MLKEIFQGFCMAMADSVPGVSGGSIAFLMGFYNEFIGALNNLISRKKEERHEAVRFLIKLGVGWIIGMGLAVTVLAVVFERQIYAISSLFLGFIIVAVAMMVLENREQLKISGINMICLIAGTGLVVLVTAFNHNTGGTTDLAALTITKGIYLFIAAMVAISAMVLPGISGSTLLLVFGLYIPVITAIKSLLHLDFVVLPALIIFGFGVLTGIILFVRWIKLSLEKFPSQTMCVIIGLMIGSLYAIAMGPTTLKVPQPPMSVESFSLLFFLIGAGIVVAMESYRHIQENGKTVKKMEEKEVSLR